MLPTLAAHIASAGPPALPGPPGPQILIGCVVLLLGVVGSGIYSGLETAIYTMSRLRLAIRHAAGQRAAVRLRTEIADDKRLLTTLLIATNTCTFIASFGLSLILKQVWQTGEWATVAIEACILTPLIFIFAETLPKDLGRAHADSVVYAASLWLKITRIVLTWSGFQPVISLLVSVATRWLGAADGARDVAARARMAALIEEGVGHGVISQRQTTIVERALRLHEVTVGAEMTPWAHVIVLQNQWTRADLLRNRSALSRSCYPVVTESGQVLGIARLIEVLRGVSTDPVDAHIEQAVWVAPNLDAPAALSAIQRAGVPLALVGSPDHPMGLVTIKDLVEPLVGELAAD